LTVSGMVPARADGNALPLLSGCRRVAELSVIRPVKNDRCDLLFKHLTLIFETMRGHFWQVGGAS